jgi:hypothetical protein
MRRWIRRKVAAWFRGHADQIEAEHPGPHYPGTLGATCAQFEQREPTLEERARRGYERQRAAAPMFAGEPKPTWPELFPEVQAIWIEKAQEVLVSPNRWIDSDAQVATFARGVLGIPEPKRP